MLMGEVGDGVGRIEWKHGIVPFEMDVVRLGER
jgi:hypothetical protein